MKKLPKLTLPKKAIYLKLAEDVDFFELFKKIEQQFETCFIFESLGEEGKYSRYSLIGFDPEQIFSARENILKVNNDEYVVENPYDSLRDMMPEAVIAREYAGGLVGALSYEAFNYFESTIHVKVHDNFDQFVFGLYKDGIIYDKLTNQISYFYYDRDRSETILNLIKQKITPQTFSAKFLRDTLTKKKHAEIVEKVKDQIRAGNTFQCEVGYKSEYKVSGNPLIVYDRLRKVNPSPFMYFVKFGNKKFIGASPELLFSLRDGQMVTRPLAGTIRRGKNETEDKQLARKLLNDTKEKAEHMMIVDMQRSDIGKVARFGTVRVKDLMTMTRFSHVQHISSEIIGLIKPTEDMFSALASNFPMPTVCGTPRIETVKIIDANESHGRGPYGGGVGHFGFNGDATFALAIRSLFIADDYAFAQTSSGIVSDSLAEKEYDEVQRKLAPMKHVLSLFEN